MRSTSSNTSKRRIVVIDTLGEYKVKGAKVFTEAAPLIEHIKKNRSFFVIAQFRKEAKRKFNRVCHAVELVKNILFIVEEVDYYISANYAPSGFDSLVRYGRHADVEMICVARRPQNMWRDLTANADFMYSCKVTEPRDVDYLSQCEYIGKKGAQIISKLKRYEYVICTDEGMKNATTKV